MGRDPREAPDSSVAVGAAGTHAPSIAVRLHAPPLPALRRLATMWPRLTRRFGLVRVGSPALLQSPLTDSNRRPPPYHGTSQATGGSRWQRIWPVFAVCGPERFAADCRRLQPRGSIKAPSAARRMSHQITAMNLCAYIVRCVRRGASRARTIEQLAAPSRPPPRTSLRTLSADAPAIQSRRSTRRPS
jgi:hypothetical protein